MSDSIRLTMTRGKPYYTESGMSLSPIYLSDPESDRQPEATPSIHEDPRSMIRSKDPRHLNVSALRTEKSFLAKLRQALAGLLRRFH
jgi:hypothetical protein